MKKYTQIYSESDGCRAVRLINKYGFINKYNQEICTPIYDDACAFKYGFAGVCKDGLWGVIDITGNFILDIKYSEQELKYKTKEDLIKFIRKEKIKSLSL